MLLRGSQRDSTDSPAPSLSASQGIAAAQIADRLQFEQREVAEENDRLRMILAEQRQQHEQAQVLSKQLYRIETGRAALPPATMLWPLHTSWP